MQRTPGHGQSGFTLLELLVVIAVLAVLGGAAVIGIGAVRSSAQRSTCTADAEVLSTALEASNVTGGSYLDETQLVTAGYLKEPSTLHDIVIIGETYEIVPVGECVEDVSEIAEGDESDTKPDDGAGAAAAAAAHPEADAKAEAEKAAVEKENAEADKEKADKEKAEKEKAESECQPGQVNLNTTNTRKISDVLGLDRKVAAQIVANRTYDSVAELTRVKELGDESAKKIVESGLACV